jgi:hypothetical protein
MGVTRGRLALALLLTTLLLGCTATPPPSVPGPRRAAEPSPSPSVLRGEQTVIGGIRTVKQEVVLPPELLPYPYTTPTPPAERTVLDGTYIRIVTFEEAGGFRYAVPRRCLRCIPYKLDPGVQTLVIHEGAFYVNHQLSGFEDLGHVLVEGNRATFFNDPICPTARGTYTWRLRGHRLDLVELDDPCAPGRAEDLTFATWLLIDPCAYRIDDLWPAALGCV